MKKLIIITCMLFVSVIAKAQKEYLAPNKINYKEGDTIKFGKGSGINAEFLYVKLAGFAAAMTYNMYKGVDQLNIDRRYQNSFGVIKHFKIKNYGGGRKKMIVNVSIGAGNRAEVMIDEAIQSCEVTPCAIKTDISNVDALLKLKSLLDSGGITQAEYDEQKKKLLNQ